MKVKDLITALLEYPMDAEVTKQEENRESVSYVIDLDQINSCWRKDYVFSFEEEKPGENWEKVVII